ncbi:hypothetical protein DPMN_053872 [Dreissena polymorpha]|uniref:Uncharacterized protein n=1 Tax=Dreissena polymorpha TaxID=45954 RepID=A0A9D4CPM9_DREPO|nr:hypothetical protein DPMN_053872 [Dreissena polymorpha]
MSTKTLLPSAMKAGLKKSKVTFDVDDKQEGESNNTDPLPIVDVKPFVQQVWRREKSFVSTWYRDRPLNIHEQSNRSDTSTTTDVSRFRELDVTSENETDDGIHSPPPKTSQSLPIKLPSTRVLNFYVNTFTDIRTQNEHFKSLVGESGWKKKNRLHPVAPSKNKKQTEHSVSIIPGFITRDDRVKTTLMEISEGENEGRIYPPVQKPGTAESFQRQQMIRVSGEPLRQSRNIPFESTPTPVSRTPNSIHVPSVRHGSPASMLYNTTNQIRENRSRRAKTPLYDHLDRTGTLPSLSIYATGLKKRHKHGEENLSEDYVDYFESYGAGMQRNIGRIENTLDYMSRHGKPTKVERQLSMELEQTLSRYRKSKDYTPFEINPAEIAKYYPGVSPTYNMTHGEILIQEAKRSNMSRKCVRNTFGHFSSAAKGSDKTLPINHTSTNNVRKLRETFNEIEHIDTYDNLPEKMQNGDIYHDERHDMSLSPEAEPGVPFDTPRSQLNSRISLKHSDNTTKPQSRGIPSKTPTSITHTKPEKQGRVKQKEAMSSSQQNANLKISDHVNNQTNKGTVVNNSRLNTSNRSTDNENPTSRSNTGAEHMYVADIPINVAAPLSDAETSLNAERVQKSVDASGRTFLTSDNVIQIDVDTIPQVPVSNA